VYPNLYVVLTAPPGRARKGGAVRQGLDLISQVATVSMAAEKTTTEALLRSLKECMKTAMGIAGLNGQPVTMYQHCSLTVWCEELGLFANKKELERGMNVLLIDMYDCPKTPENPMWTYDLITREATVIPLPCFNIITCTTPKWLAKNMSMEIDEGLPSRMIYVVEFNKRHRDATGIIPPENLALRPDLIKDLNRIHEFKGPFEFENEAQARYGKWYVEELDKDRVIRDERFDAYYERKHHHLLKLAMVHAASRLSHTVTTHDINAGLVLLEQTEYNMPKAFGVGSESMESELLVKINDVIFNSGKHGVKRSTLGRMFWRQCPTSEGMKMLLGTLVDMGRIIENVGHPTRYFPAKGVKPDMLMDIGEEEPNEQD